MEKLNVAIADVINETFTLLGEIISRDKELELVGQADNGKDIQDYQGETAGCGTSGYYYAEDGRLERDGEDQSGYDTEKASVIYRSFCGGTERITEDAFQQGAAYYIMKPFDNEMVINRIKQLRGETAPKGRNLHRAAGQEVPEKKKEQNLEMDVTNIIHGSGYRLTSKGISI